MSLPDILNDGEQRDSEDSTQDYEGKPADKVSRDTPSPTAEWTELSNLERTFVVLRAEGELTYDGKNLGGKLYSGDNGYPTLNQLFGSPGECLDAAISLSRREAEKGAIGPDQMPRRISLALESADPGTKRQLVYEIAGQLARTGNYHSDS